MAPRKRIPSGSKRKSSSKTTSRKKTTKKRASSLSFNDAAQLKAYQALEKQIEDAWSQLRSDVKRRADPKIIVNGSNRLMLLLGECEYMKQECKRCMQK